MSEKFLLSNFVSSFLMKWGNIDSFYAMSISSLVVAYITKIDFNFLIEIISTNIILIMVAIILCGSFFAKRFLYESYLVKKKKCSMRIFDDMMMRDIIKYITMEPKIFQMLDMESNNDIYTNQSPGFIYLASNINIKFKDHNFNLQGTLKTGDIIKHDEKKVEKFKYIDIILDMDETNKNDILPYQYYEKINKFIKDLTASSTDIAIYYTKVLPVNKHDIMGINTIIYTGKRDAVEERFQNNIMTYFSPIRDRIWKQVEEIHYHPEKIIAMGQSPSLNLLFHGPPGTGKSTFARRIAISLGRHLFSINIANYIKKKRRLFCDVFNPIINDRFQEPNNVIFLLEEFDNTVRLLEKNNIKKREKSIESKVDGKDDDNKDVPYECQLHLHDLLELFQGPCPIPGSIFIATTNNLEYIQTTLPALVRDGRLTPWYFGYLDWPSFQELVLFYFKKETKLQKVKIELATSSIIDMALRYRDDPNGLDLFEKDFRERQLVH